MNASLTGKKIAFLATDGVEQIELTAPWRALQAAGAKVVLVSIKPGYLQGMNHDEKGDVFEIDTILEKVSSEDFDGLVLPGGVTNPDTLRTVADAVEFVRGFFREGKAVAAICHGPWLLVEAGVVKGKTLTSWPSLRTDIINAGGNWVDEEVCCDNGMVTSRKPDDLDAFCKKAIEEFAEARHAATL
jgi:protease I